MTRLLPLIVMLSLLGAVRPQEPPKSAAPPAEAPPQVQITLLETKVRFESNGDSRKEVHCVVKINSEVGVRQFARLDFDYNRSFQQIEIPFVRVTHSSGGTADILPSAITDNPNSAVINYPAYHDVRVKSVRILGLAPSDTLEYRVITTTTHHPLAPDFWLDHSFDRSGIVSHELFELDLPADRKPQIRIGPATPPKPSEASSEPTSRLLYRWDMNSPKGAAPPNNDNGGKPDVMLTTIESWLVLSQRLGNQYLDFRTQSGEIAAKARDLVADSKSQRDQLEVIYNFVSEKISTINLNSSAISFPSLPPAEVLSSGRGTPEDKTHLLVSLISAAGFRPAVAFTSDAKEIKQRPPAPSALNRILASTTWKSQDRKRHGVWMDTALEVAPFGLILADQRGKPALFALAYPRPGDDCVVAPDWTQTSNEIPFPSTQKVAITSFLDVEGELKAKVKYAMRGDNELLLRVAFHESPREKWNEVAQLLSLSDGFRGKVEKVSASDPYATKEPFTVEYEISQPKFVDWSKKPVRIPAVLPLVGLPDPPADAKSPIELGTPLDVQTTVTLHLPPGTTVESPAGTTVDRDYATFSSQYSASGTTITATRHIHFIARELPANRAPDYNAFVRAIQNDQSQFFRLTRPD